MSDEFALYDYHNPDYNEPDVNQKKTNRKRKLSKVNSFVEQPKNDSEDEWPRKSLFIQEWNKIENIINERVDLLCENTTNLLYQFIEDLFNGRHKTINKIPVGILSLSMIGLIFNIILIFDFNFRLYNYTKNNNDRSKIKI